jgi:subtilisin
MKIYLLAFLAVISLVNFSSCDNGGEEEPDPCVSSSSVTGAVITDRYIVSLPSGDDEGDSGGRVRNQGLSLLRRNNLSDERLVHHFRGKNSMYVLNVTADEAARLKADNEVLKIESDKVVSICACFEVLEPRLITWNVEKVGYGDGRGKTAWVLDSGVDLDHPDLDVDQERSRSFHPDFETAEDGQGHGTHTAGIIGALNNGIGTLGVASGAKIVALKVLDDEGNGTVSYILNALTYIRENGRSGEVVNLSLSVDADVSTILDEEIQDLASRGFFIAIAAGNDSKMASDFSPARANGSNIFTVSAVDSLDRFASWSNYGNDAVDFAAPGVKVLSSYMQGKYAIISGTSQAAPHVAGILLINNGKVNSLGNALNDPDGVADPLAHR